MLRTVSTVVLVALLLAGCSSGARTVSLVITHGTVVTVDGGDRVIRDGAVAIDGTDIVAVDTTEAITQQFRGRDAIDAGRQLEACDRERGAGAREQIRGAIEALGIRSLPFKAVPRGLEVKVRC